MRVISFTDRFGVERHVGFMPPQKEIACRAAYGAHWPRVKAYLVDLALLQERCRRPS